MQPPDNEIWVPVRFYLPLGLAKSWPVPNSCMDVRSLLCGPFAIIFLAQTSNTVLVPVLPFLVKEIGSNAMAYGLLQSTLWTSQTVLAPVLGALSDRIGRRPTILFTLLISALGNGLLAISHSLQMMAAARITSGLGFQIALFRACAAAPPVPHRALARAPPPSPCARARAFRIRARSQLLRGRRAEGAAREQVRANRRHPGRLALRRPGAWRFHLRVQQ